MLSASDFPRLPFSLDSLDSMGHPVAASIIPTYLMFDFLNDLQPNLGASWLSAHYTPYEQSLITAAFGTMSEWYGVAQTVLDASAKVMAVTIQGAQGNFAPLVIAGIESFANSKLSSAVVPYAKILEQELFAIVPMTQIVNLQLLTTTVDLSSDTIVVKYTNGSASEKNVTISGPRFGVLDTALRPVSQELTLDNYGSIIGTQVAGVRSYSPVILHNYGLISGFNGVWVAGGSGVLNGPGGSISGGGVGLWMEAGANGVYNLGNITASIGSAIEMTGVGAISIDNGDASNTTAAIAGGQFGIESVGVMTLNNFGSIKGGTNALSLGAGGSVTNGSPNSSTASIIGGNYGIYIYGSNACTINNYGTIKGTDATVGTGIGSSGTGTVTIINGSSTNTTAAITGGFQGIGTTGVTTLTNYGAITGTNASVLLGGGGSVTNGSDGSDGSKADTTASITGGVRIAGGGTSNSLSNFGSIAGGVSVLSGNVTNGSSTDTKASITGASGITAVSIGGASGTVQNYGTITGVGFAVTFAGSGTLTNAGTITTNAGRAGTAINLGTGARLVQAPGSVIIGRVVGGGGSTMELAAGSSAGSISGIGTTTTVGTVAVDAGATWTLTGTNSVANFVDNGTAVIANGGSLAISTALDPTSSGVFQLQGQSSLEIAAALGINSKIQFLGSTPTNKLIIDSAAKFGTNVGAASYAGTLLENFAAGDVIDIKGIASAGLQLAYSTLNGVLQIAKSGGGAVASLLFQNSTLGAGAFHVAADGTGGTLLTHS